MSAKAETHSQAHFRAVRAAKFAEHFVDSDLFDLDRVDWALAARLLEIKPASDATKAMTAAVLDVHLGKAARTATGTAAERIAYNTGRRAALAAQAFAGLRFDPAEAEDDQWSAVKVSSVATREVTLALYELFLDLTGAYSASA